MADAKEPVQSVQVFGRKKTATAVAYCKRGKGLIKVTFKVITKVKIEVLAMVYRSVSKHFLLATNFVKNKYRGGITAWIFT